jgi:hypothetical protein
MVAAEPDERNDASASVVALPYGLADVAVFFNKMLVVACRSGNAILVAEFDVMDSPSG